MSRTYLSGVAAAAIALSASGAFAQGVPVVVAVTPAAETEIGTTVAFDFEGRANLYATNFAAFNVWLSLDGKLDVRSGAGLGFRFTGGGELDLPGLGGDAEIRGEIYHTLGEGRIGLFASTDIPADFTSFGAFGRLVWGHVSYEQETRYDLTVMGGRIRSENALTFNEGGRFEPTLYSRVTFDGTAAGLDVGAGAIMRPSSAVYVRTAVWTSILNGPAVWSDTTVSLTLGEFKPYATAALGWSPADFTALFTLGGQLEHPIGGGPLSLTAGGNVRLAPGEIPDGYAYVGFRFSGGEFDTAGHLGWPEDH